MCVCVCVYIYIYKSFRENEQRGNRQCSWMQLNMEAGKTSSHKTYNQNLKEVRKLTIQISRGKAFQAEETADEEVLSKCVYKNQ